MGGGFNPSAHWYWEAEKGDHGVLNYWGDLIWKEGPQTTLHTIQGAGSLNCKNLLSMTKRTIPWHTACTNNIFGYLIPSTMYMVATISVYIYIHTQGHGHIHICIYIHIHIHICICIYVYGHIHIHICICIYMYMCIYTLCIYWV